MAMGTAKILVADDQKTIRVSLEERIKKMGYSVDLASDGVEAWEKISKESFDLVILDRNMPGYTGVEVLKKMRCKPHLANLPVMFFSSENKLAEKEYVFALGANDYLVKSTGSAELEMRIRALLKREEELKVVMDANLREIFRRSFQNYSGLSAMFASVLPAIARLMNMEAVVQSRIEDGTVYLENEFQVEEIITHPRRVPIGETFCSRVAETGAPVFIGNPIGIKECFGSLMGKKIASYIGIPLFIRGNFYGTLAAYSKFPRKFNDFSIELIQLFAQKISYEIERERMQTEINEAQDALVEARSLSSMSRMTASIAHEMRQPLVAADMDLAGLSDDLEDGDAKETAKGVRARVKEALLIIRTILKMFRGGGKSLPMEHDLNSELKNIVFMLGRKAKGVDIVYNLAERAKIVTGVNVNTIMANLIGNALDALKNSGRLELSTKYNGDSVIVTVEDNGPGIPAEILEKVFESGFSTKKSGEGSGIGLWISRMEADRAGGRITAESEVGKFTRFQVSLPLFVKQGEGNIPSGEKA